MSATGLDSVGDLLRQFLNLTAGTDAQPGLWLVVWRMFADSPWYAAELDRCARRAIRATGAPPHWLDDVKQDAVLLLARTLRKSPDLNVDRERVRDSFAAWMRTIVTRHCHLAIRRTRRCAGRETPDQEYVVRRPAHAAIERKVQLSLAIESLEQPAREIVSLKLKGYHLTEVAAALDMDYTTVYRRFRRALAKLRTELDP